MSREATSTPPRRADVPGWTRGTGWGWIWGADDQIGALNAMTPESVREALHGVSEGRVFDLGVTIERRSYVGPFHARTEVVAFRTAAGLRSELEAEGIHTGGVSFNTTMVIISDHAGTQIDGLCHATFGDDEHWYNGFTSAEHRDDFGAARASAGDIPPVVLTAVLIDVAGYLGKDCLEPHFAIEPELLEAALKAQSVEVAPGEAVFIRTGTLRHWGEAGLDHAAVAGPDTAGITLASARWLVEEKGSIFIGSDTSTVEVMPPVDGDNAAPVHKYLLVDQGVHMGELHSLEALAAEPAHRFCYAALTPKVRGTTGGFALRPMAIV